MGVSAKDRVLRVLGRQDWLRGRDRIIRAFSHPERQESRFFEVDFFGESYSGNMRNFIDWCVFYYGSFSGYELLLLGALADALRAQGKPVNFYDVGANIGQHTLFMSRHADRVLSFEPFSVVRNEMARKLNHAGVENVTILPVALGDENETRAFHPPTGCNQGTGTLGNLLPENASSNTIQVEVARGDDFLAANRMPPISLLKMDVEGYEIKALSGLRETIWRDRPPIFLEIQPIVDGDAEAANAERIEDLLYPDHVLFGVTETRGKFVLKPFSLGGTDEALVLPRELAGIIPGTAPR